MSPCSCFVSLCSCFESLHGCFASLSFLPGPVLYPPVVVLPVFVLVLKFLWISVSHSCVFRFVCHTLSHMCLLQSFRRSHGAMDLLGLFGDLSMCLRKKKTEVSFFFCLNPADTQTLLETLFY